MCIMEVRAGQRSSTIAQACAHNTTTVERDVDMFCGILNARGDLEREKQLRAAQAELQRAYAGLLNLFTEFVADEETHVHVLSHAHPDDNDHGSERLPIPHMHHDENGGHNHGTSLVERAHHDATLARKYMTR